MLLPTLLFAGGIVFSQPVQDKGAKNIESIWKKIILNPVNIVDHPDNPNLVGIINDELEVAMGKVIGDRNFDEFLKLTLDKETLERRRSEN